MKNSLILAFCAAAALTACAGGDDNNPSTPAATTEVPPEASMSATGFIDYLKQLVVAAADTLEPVDVSAVTPPTDDTTEPSAVD